MRRLAFAILVLLMTFSTGAAVKVIAIKHVAAGPTNFCAGSFDICDEFSTTQAPITSPAYVDCSDGDCTGNDIGWLTNGTQLRGPTSLTGGLALLHPASTSGTDQYGIVQLAVNDFDMGMLLHSNGVSGYADIIYYWDNGGTPVVGWAEGQWTGVSAGDVGRCDLTINNGQYLIGKVVGTTATRTVYVWVTSTMPTAAPTGAGDCSWVGSGACTGPNCTTGVPGQTADGQRVGLWAYDSTGPRTYDNFAAGSP